MTGLRVLEIGDYAAPDAGRLFVGLGADVVLVEPPGGVAARRSDPVGFAHRAAGKSAVSTAAAAYVAAGCDVILDGTHGGELAPVAAELAAAAGCDAVVVALVPYGDRGPAARWAATDLTVAAAGGMLSLVGDPDRPPLRPYGDQADQLAAVNAVIAALLALRARGHTGQGQRVVVSGQASVAASLEFGAISYIHTGRVPRRTGHTHPMAPHTLFTAADGMLAGGLGGNPRMWNDLVTLLAEHGVAGDLADERWQDPAYRVAHREEIFTALAAVVGRFERDRFFHSAQARRLPWAAVLRPEELVGNAQLVERDFFLDVETSGTTVRDVGFAFRLTGAAPTTPLRVPQPAPTSANGWREGRTVRPAPRSAVTHHRAAVTHRGALHGVRVLDLTWVLAGPYGTKVLADHGADVIKVESRHRPDPTRFAADFHLSRSDNHDPNGSGYFNNYNRGKKSITLNLRTPEGRQLALRLARHCDVVVENFAAGVLDRLGLSYDRLREVRDDIVVVSMSGMGHTGPWRDYVSYADAVSALSGWTALTGEPDVPPVGVVFGLADIIAGHHAALATLGALAVRDRTGCGQHVDLAQLEAAASHLGDALLRASLAGEAVKPLGNRHPRMAPHGVFPCDRDGGGGGDNGDRGDGWVAIAARDDEEYARLAAATGLPGDSRFATVATRKANEDDLERLLGDWTRQRSAETVAQILQQHGVPAYPVRDGRTLVDDDRALRAWEFYQPVTHPSAGTFPHEGLTARLEGTPGGVHAPAPLLGEHTDEVLGSLLGLGRAELDVLRDGGVLE